MLASKSLRCTGSSIQLGRQQLSANCAARRHISLQAHTRPTQRSVPRDIRHCGQTRSLSLFGWGSSSSSSSQNTPLLTKEPEVEIGNSSLSEVRTFKASHATSDAPDPSLSHHAVSPVEPPIVEGIQEAVAFPSTSEKVAGIIDGEVDISSIPERLGYLKEVCGLDYGWGTTTMVEWTLEHLHVTGGLSWATSIVVIAAITRLALVQPTIKAQKESAKLKELNPIIAPLREKANQYLKEGNRQKQLETTTEMRSIYKEYDVKFSRVFLPLLIQLPIQFSAFRLLNAAGRLPVPGFVEESWLWNHDLTFADPYYLTPALSAFFMWIQIKQQAKTQASGGPMSPAVTKLIGNVLPVMSLVFMSWQPGAVQLYFMTTSLFALINGEALRQGAVRRMLSLPELTPTVATTPAGTTSPVSTAGGGSVGRPATISSTPHKNGFQMRSKIVIADEVETAASDRSVIDKLVDKAKDRKWGKNFHEATKGFRKSKDDLQREKDEKYETERSQQLDMERDMRNSAAKGSKDRKTI